jgi:hypothetical protein
LVKKIRFDLKEQIVSLTGTCFWYWNSYHSFLDSCGVPKSLYNRYPKESFNKYQVMRNVLEVLEEQNKNDVINNIISNFYRLRNAVDKDNLDNKKAKQLLEEFREIVGNDPIENEIKKQKQEQSRVDYQQSVEQIRSKTKKLDQLNNEFISLTTSTDLSPQQRGYKLEDLFFDLLQFSEFEYSKPYRTPDGEQIDGHFKYEKFDYLVEVKWIDGLTKQKDLSIFDGKIRGKAQSTRGFFISANGFDENAVNKFSGDAPRIVLMSGQDLAMVLNGQFTFFDAMKAKVNAIVRYGNINYPLR